MSKMDYEWMLESENERLKTLNEELLEALEELVSYTKACEVLLNVTNAGQVHKAELLINKAKGLDQ